MLTPLDKMWAKRVYLLYKSSGSLMSYMQVNTLHMLHETLAACIVKSGEFHLTASIIHI